MRCEWSFNLPARRFTHNCLIRHVAKDIKSDTADIRNDTRAIKDDTAQILAEIARLQERLPKQVENDYILQHFLEEMTAYTEQTLDRPYSDGRSPTPTVIKPDCDPPGDIYLEDRERTAVKSQENLSNQRNKSCEDESQQQIRSIAEPTVPACRAISSPQDMHGHSTSSDSESDLQDIRPDNHESPALVNIYTPKPMEEEVCLSYYEGTTRGRLVINYPVTRSIRQNIRDQECYESTHNRFTAVACSPVEFDQLRHPFRPGLFEKPRHTAIVFVLKVTIQTTYETFMHQWNFVTTAISQATQKVEVLRESLPQDYFLPWQHTVVLVHCPSSSHYIRPTIRYILTGLGVQHHRDDLVTLIGRTSLNPSLPRDTIEGFQKHIMATIHEVGYY
jgi:hypothetical protein